MTAKLTGADSFVLQLLVHAWRGTNNRFISEEVRDVRCDRFRKEMDG